MITKIYTDGSFTKDEKGDMKAGYAAHVTSGSYLSQSKTPTLPPESPLHPDTLSFEDTIPSAIFGRSPHCRDSYSAEIVAIIGALLMPPPENSAHIVSDNEPSVTVIPTFATRTRRKQMQLQYHNLFRITAFLISARSTILEWVRAHIGNVPNEVADALYGQTCGNKGGRSEQRPARTANSSAV